MIINFQYERERERERGLARNEPRNIRAGYGIVSGTGGEWMLGDADLLLGYGCGVPGNRFCITVICRGLRMPMG